MNANLKLISMDYHRNGISGVPFHVALVDDTTNGPTPERMVIIRLDKQADEGAGGILCAAFNVALLAEGNIRFFENSYRGDWYASFMDQEITKWEAGADERLKAVIESQNKNKKGE